jgi:hypothetical protein
MLHAAGWPKPLEVVPARVGKLRASIKGDALYGTICGRDYTLTLTTADQFGNPRCAAYGCAQGTLVSMPRSTVLLHRQTLAALAADPRPPAMQGTSEAVLLACGHAPHSEPTIIGVFI